MSDYRRARLQGGTYFFTLCLADRSARTLVEEVGLLRDVVASVRNARPFVIEAMVVLPDHLHAVWRLPPGDADFSLRWKEIKATFSRHSTAGGRARARLDRKGERSIWQRGYWERCLRDEADLAAHVAYCWQDPVKHGLAARAEAWPYSSIHRDIRAGKVAGGLHATGKMAVAGEAPCAPGQRV